MTRVRLDDAKLHQGLQEFLVDVVNNAGVDVGHRLHAAALLLAHYEPPEPPRQRHFVPMPKPPIT